MDDNREILTTVHDLLDQKDFRQLKELVQDLHAPDALELIMDIDSVDRVVIFRLLHKTIAAEVFTDMPPEQRAILLEQLTEQQTAAIFEALDPDDRAEVLEEFPAGVVKDILTIISPEEREMTCTLLGYPENSCGRIMTPEIIEIRPFMTAAQALEHIRRVGLNKEMIYTCYVISQHRKLQGTVSLRDIFFAPADALIRDIMTPNPLFVHTHDDQEVAAGMALKYDLLAVPVVDKEDRLVGIITIDDLTDVIKEEASEDAYRMAGIGNISESYFNTKIVTLFQRRIVWLLLLMVAQIMSDEIIKHFDEALKTVIALVFFMPMLAGSAGNTATQSATLVIRGLAVGEIDLFEVWRILARESVMGILLGALLGVVGGSIAFFMGNDPRLFTAVSVSFMTTIFMANMLGAVLPLFIKRIGFDPAITSGPAITTILDIASLTIYFSIAIAVFNLSV